MRFINFAHKIKKYKYLRLEFLFVMFDKSEKNTVNI
jgi:hypothetical protein